MSVPNLANISERGLKIRFLKKWSKGHQSIVVAEYITPGAPDYILYQTLWSCDNLLTQLAYKQEGGASLQKMLIIAELTSICPLQQMFIKAACTTGALRAERSR